MRVSLAFLFVTSLLIQIFNKQVVVLHFQLNQSEIAKTLCVRKELKGNTCQGKCHLKKELNKLDSNEKKQGSSKKMTVDFTYISSIVTNYSFGYKNQADTNDFFYSYSIINKAYRVVLQPPQA